MNYSELVEVFNCDELEDFRQLIKSQMKVKGYKNGYQIFHAFELSFPLVQDYFIFRLGSLEDNYQQFIDCYFKILFGD